MADTFIEKESSWVSTESIGTDAAIDIAIAEVQEQFESYSEYQILRVEFQGNEITPTAIKVVVNLKNAVLKQDQPPPTVSTPPTETPSQSQEQQTAPTDSQIKETVARDGTISNSVSLIFPLSTEITIKINEFSSYLSKISKLLQYYKNQLKVEEKEIKNYDLMYELAALNGFLPKLEAAIRASNAIKPVIADNPEKISILDYEYVTLKILNQEVTDSDRNIIVKPLREIKDRKFSDGSTRPVLVYNRIDNIYLKNQTFNYSLLTTAPIENTEIFQISPTTLSLIFNLDRIVNEQINDIIPTSLLMCAGRDTQISRLDGTFSFFGFPIPTLSSKVILQDFLNAYVFETREITTAPRPPIPAGCNDEVRARISVLNGSIKLYEFNKLFTSSGGVAENNTPAAKKFEQDKKELAQLVKLCPDLNSKVIIFEDIKNLDSLGKLFSQFLERYNLACIVDEAIKCVMPQIPCEQILSNLTVDNFQERLTTAFPHQKNIIRAISLNVRESIDKEEERRFRDGEPPLDFVQKNKQVLDSINKFIDLEALCKIDLNAIIELIKGLFNIKFDLFNMFDWRFNFKIEFNQAILEALLAAIFAMIDQILNELIGCDALDGLIAGLINSNVDAPSGLYGDIQALFGGDFDFSNLDRTLRQNVENFLSQSADEMSRIIRVETSLNNPLFGGISTNANLGITPDLQLATAITTRTDALGGLVRNTTTNTGSLGIGGFTGTNSESTFTIDTTALASTEGQRNFLQEIGRFEIEQQNGQTTFNRISNDSVVNLVKTPVSGIDVTAGNTLEQAFTAQQSTQNDIFSASRVRNKNRHLLNSLAILNEREGTASLLTTQKSLAEQIKEYVKSCFSLLSPSEVIDLMTANPSNEVKLTIFGISKIRYPLLNLIMQTPERHALLFASFGKLTKLDTLGSRLQILSSTPSVKQRLFDPNICAPFTDVYDFRKALMNQTLPKDLADDLIDKLVEDDKNRANKLIDSLAKGIKPQSLKPEGLAANKTPDGKNIEEIDKVIDGALSNIFDQIKISFDNELETYPNATATSSQVPVRVYEKETSKKVSLFGFAEQESEPYTNKEYTDLKAILGDPPSDQTDAFGKYFLKQGTQKNVGGLFKNAFEKYNVNLINNDLPLLIQADGTITAADPIDGVSSAFTGSENNRPPKWNFEYSETNNAAYKFVIKTTGDIKNSTPPAVRYAESVSLSGALIQNEAIKLEMTQLGLSETTSRKEAFRKIFKNRHSKIYFNTSISDNIIAVRNEADSIFEKIIENVFRDINYTNTKLLHLTASSPLDESKKATLISLIDFSPKQTEQQKACGIDTHLLQTEAVKKRIIDEYNNSPPPSGLVSSNSKINSRYSDDSPGHLSEKIMTGLADTFIRTCVIHNIFKGLFIFDKYKYSLVNFGIEELIYSFIENRVKTDIQNSGLKSEFEKEYEKIYNIFKKKELIPQTDNGENKLLSIVKYHITSVLKMISKMLGVDAPPKPPVQTSNTGSFGLMTTVTITGSIPGFPTPLNIDPVHTARRKNFLDSLPVVSPYSNFWNTLDVTLLTSETRTETNCQITTDRWGNEEQYCSTTEVPIGQNKKAFWPDTYVSNNFKEIQEIIKNKTLTVVGSGQPIPKPPVLFVLEKYVKIKFKQQLPNTNNRYYPLYYEFSRNHNGQLNGIISFKNFEIMMKKFLDASRNANPPILYDKNRPELSDQFWLEEEPKFGLRLNIIKPVVTLAQPMEQITANLEENGGFIHSYYFDEGLYGTKRDISNSVVGNAIKNNNVLNKAGTVQTLKETWEQIININEEAQNIVNLENSYIFTIVPFISEELEMSQDMYNLDPSTRPQNFYNEDFIEGRYVMPYQFLRSKILTSPMFDVLVNYCLPTELASTFALMNSMVGMANESIIKLLNGTKDVIKANYNIQKNAGKFKNKQNSSAYEKQKSATQDGPPPAAFAKAALTMPIGILKGLATAVDPNIFLADKIVLAGKMGFVQPRYRRVVSGEEFRVQGTNRKETILEGGVAMGNIFDYENGELVIKQQPSGLAIPLIDYNPIAEVRDGKVVRNSEGKLVVKQGVGTGVPVKKEGSDYVLENSNLDEQNVTAFDQVPSLPIFPGERINIPYSIASLALAPFPIFSPGLTTYNIAMPFGPLFLAMEPLIYETPQFKAASVKEPGSPADTGGNLSCDDTNTDEQ
jgi:hypothetical protein